MKNVAKAVVTFAVTAVCFSLLPRSNAATTPSAPVGRYAITHLSEQFALMTDTATGAVWQYAFGDYCESKSPPYGIRAVGYGQQCKESESSISHIPMLQRVSVEGLYKTPTQKWIDVSIQRQLSEDVRDLVHKNAKPKQ